MRSAEPGAFGIGQRKERELIFGGRPLWCASRTQVERGARSESATTENVA